MKKNIKVVAVDFDGTCVAHSYPDVGQDIGAVPVLQKLVEKGYMLMLWTMRGSVPHLKKETLKEAVQWFADNDLPLWGVNHNPEQKRTGWSDSSKQHANFYIDDAALGAPLKFDPAMSDRPFIDWVKIELLLTENGIL